MTTGVVMSFREKDINQIEQYWDARPCNIRHSNKPVGTREYFNEVDKRRYFVEPHILSFAEFDKWKNKDVLEIGCGIGTDSVNFARNGANLVATDLSKTSLDICQGRFAEYELPAQFYHGNAENMSHWLQPRPFDLIYSFGVLHHTPSPEDALNEIKLYMDRNSELRFMVYNRASIKVLQIMNEYGCNFTDLDDMISMYSEAQTGCPVTHSYTVDTISNLLNNLGYRVLSVEKNHIFKYSIPHYVQYQYVVDEQWEGMSVESFQALEKQFGWHLLVKAQLK